MACKIMIRATNGSSDFPKGSPVGVFDVDVLPGNLGELPNFVWITITDRDKEDITPYLAQWPIEYQYTVVSNETDYWRIRVEVDPLYVDASETSKSVMKTQMTTFLSEYGAYSITYTTSSITFNLPKTADTDDLKSQFADVFNEIFDFHRYYFGNGVVNNIVSQGGYVETDFATMVSYVRDKLDD